MLSADLLKEGAVHQLVFLVFPNLRLTQNGSHSLSNSRTSTDFSNIDANTLPLLRSALYSLANCVRTPVTRQTLLQLGFFDALPTLSQSTDEIIKKHLARIARYQEFLGAAPGPDSK